MPHMAEASMFRSILNLVLILYKVQLSQFIDTLIG